MDIIHNQGEKIGFSDVAVSNEKSVTIYVSQGSVTWTARPRWVTRILCRRMIGRSVHHSEHS